MNYKVGEEIKAFEIVVDKYQPYYYAGASLDFNSIHIDDEFAKKVGLGGIILQGLCTMAYVYRAVMSSMHPSKLKKLKVRFRGVVRPNDKVIVKGKLTSLENNLATIELVAENQKGEQVITNASAVVENNL